MNGRALTGDTGSASIYYDRLRLADGETFLLKVRSMVGLIPLLASARVAADLADMAGAGGGAFAQLGEGALGRRTDTADGAFVSMVEPAALAPMLADVFDENSFLSPFGLRSLSARLRDHPYEIPVPGTDPIEYEPAEASARHVNSNWRGPVWMPVNYLLIDAIARIGDELGDRAPTFAYPTGTGPVRSLWRRQNDQRPIFGGVSTLQNDPEWRENLLFFEYFHGDNGAGLGAMHQTGWTALVADPITGRRLSPDPLGALRAS